MDFSDATCYRQVSRGLPNIWLSGELQDQRRAMTLCRQCPLHVECMIYALKTGASCGVWAGRMFGKYVEEEERNGTAKADAQ